MGVAPWHTLDYRTRVHPPAETAVLRSFNRHGRNSERLLEAKHLELLSPLKPRQQHTESSFRGGRNNLAWRHIQEHSVEEG